MEIPLRRAADVMFNEIPHDQKFELITKSRWTCDSHWMMSLVSNAGWKVANKANMEVCQRVGYVEMQRLIKAMHVDKPVSTDEFLIMLKLAMEAFLTKDYFRYELRCMDSGQNVAIIHQCYPNTKLRSINAEKNYQCGCFALRAGWYQALNVEVKEKLIKCLKEGDECCEIRIEDIHLSS